MYCVYKHTTPSGKSYIGITMNDPQRRWGHGTNYRTNKYFSNAIKKYGWENISHEVIYQGLTKEEACEKEKELIAKFRTCERDHGYNLTSGGESYEFPEEVKDRLKGPRLLSEEQREELAKRGRIIAEKYLKGRTPTKEQIAKMAESKKGKKQPQWVKDKRAKSLKEHYKKVGGLSQEHREKIRNASTGRRHSEEAIRKMRAAQAPYKNSRSRRVRQLLDGKTIAEYCSAREAERQTGISYTSIVRVCNGVRLKHAGGYAWEYIEPTAPLQLELII